MRFTVANLSVTWNDPAGAVHAWHPGDVDTLNLGGLTYSLDNISKTNLPEGQMDLESPVNDMIPGIDVLLAKAQPGLLSRAGYAFIDDSQTPVWNAHGTWIEPRQRQNGQDWYLFTYNRDYHKVLSEYAALCGPIPMIPRYVLGPWITDFNFRVLPRHAGVPAAGLRAIRISSTSRVRLSRLRQSLIPLDTLVLDFAWHNYGWQGGYDWSPLIPHPDELLSWLHGQGVKLSINDHPGYANTDESILSFSDSHAPQVLRALGRPLPPRPVLRRMDILEAVELFHRSSGSRASGITGTRPIVSQRAGSRSASGCPGKSRATRAIGALAGIGHRFACRQSSRVHCLCTWARSTGLIGYSSTARKRRTAGFTGRDH